MLLPDLVARLNDLFRPAAVDEHDGWDFAFGPGERDALLARAAVGFADTFNGLMLAPARETDEPLPIDRVHLLVFPERSLIDRVVADEAARGAPGAMIVTHHVADFETSNRGFLSIPVDQLDALLAANVAFYVLHAPLDCHLEVSTSGAIADGLGLRRLGVFAPYHGGFAGVLAKQAPEPFAAFAERVRTLCELPGLNAAQVRHAGRLVSRVAVLAGGGDDLDSLTEVSALDVDTYLTGTWWSPHRSPWADENRAAVRAFLPSCPLNLLGASHDGSELVVLRDRMAPLLTEWGLGVALVRQEDHWR